jgi:hypothetical protein
MDSYWKKRCLLAENLMLLIHKNGEIEAFEKWHKCKDEEKLVIDEFFCDSQLADLSGDICFKKNRIYSKIAEQPLILVNEQGNMHVPGKWEHHFTKIDKK